jgi:HPt (histidine-containing phosphotransfer) domain-containing protein
MSHHLLTQPTTAVSSGSGQETNLAFADLCPLLDRIKGNEGLLRELVALFLEDFPMLLEEIRRAIANQNADQLSHAAHTLKGSVGFFTSQSPYAAVSKLEALGSARDWDQAEKAYAVLEHALNQLRPALTELVAE